MKRFMVLLILLFSSKCFADVTAEIISKKIDENGNIEIHTQYKIDGVEVQSNYPPDSGKYYFVTRYSFLNFVNLSDDDKKNRILSDISSYAKGLIERTYSKKTNEELIKDNFLINIVGQSITETESTIKINPTLEYKVKTDGTKTDIIIEPVIIP